MGFLRDFTKKTQDVNRAGNAVNQTKRTAGNVAPKGKKDKKAGKGKAVEAGVMPDGAWECACGAANTAKFCGGCGKAKPCCPKCGIETTAKFCGECGSATDSE